MLFVIQFIFVSWIVFEDYIYFVVFQFLECVKCKIKFEFDVNWCIDGFEGVQIQYYCVLFDSEVEVEIWWEFGSEELWCVG